MPVAKQHPVVSFSDSSQDNQRPSPLTSAMEIIPAMDPPSGPSRGAVLSEEIGNNYFAAAVTVERESMLLLKATYHPNWRATVDGEKAETVMLMPSFVGVRLPPGDHQVRIEYRPRRLRMVLLGLGLLTLPLIAIGEKPATALVSRFATGVAARISNSMKRSKSSKPNQTQGRRRHR
jgi:hypothetical protein